MAMWSCHPRSPSFTCVAGPGPPAHLPHSSWAWSWLHGCTQLGLATIQAGLRRLPGEETRVGRPMAAPHLPPPCSLGGSRLGNGSRATWTLRNDRSHTAEWPNESWGRLSGCSIQSPSSPHIPVPGSGDSSTHIGSQGLCPSQLTPEGSGE